MSTKKYALEYGDLKSQIRNIQYEWDDLAKKFCKTKKQKDIWFEVKCVLQDAESGIDEVIKENS